MNNSTTHTPLSRELVLFLWEHGYSHFLSKGITETNPISSLPNDENDYILQPIKPGDLRHQFEEAEFIISHFDSLDTQDMLNGADDIRFMVEIPVEDYANYLKQH